jgi:hypothetical protein
MCITEAQSLVAAKNANGANIDIAAVAWMERSVIRVS